MLLLQVFPAPQATFTRRGGVSGSGGRKRMGAGVSSIWTSTQKIGATGVILSSYNTKKLVVDLISTERGRPQGEGVNGQSYHYQICYRCPYAYEYVSTFWQERDHICRNYVKTLIGSNFADRACMAAFSP